ncbi:hypothetical protein TSAR_009930 [Trichomalopsis sarcophagae]|uniref:N-acetyltransferase domain-containing protein n=1 Tax=Trichomalopsis sarcophagae TaxID=543379 RepID=A0A232F6G7_9HYME|nr:hypothetical protein TSAR_009930 [Trichomalopsis sarcophagae]
MPITSTRERETLRHREHRTLCSSSQQRLVYTIVMLRFCPLSLKIMEKVVEIRESEKEDCPQIRALIQELADFEEMKDGPKIDYQVIEKDGFDSENPLYNCHVAVCNGKIVGYALYFYIFSTLEQKAIHLEDLYVTPDYRNKKIGSRLFDSVAKRTFDEKCQYLDFSVLSWNPAQNFYKAKGAVDLTEVEGWHMYRLNQESLQNLASKHANDLYEVRDARIEDFNSIKRMAQEGTTQKNKNEQNHDEICISIEENKDFDKPNPYSGYLVALLNDKIVGYALYCYSYSTWEGKSMYLQEFYVSENEHTANMRNDLFRAVAKKAIEEKCSRIDFWMLDPKNAGKFYSCNGAVDLTESEEWHLYRLFEHTKKPL